MLYTNLKSLIFTMDLKIKSLNKADKIRYLSSVTVLENIHDLSWIKAGEFLLTSDTTLNNKDISLRYTFDYLEEMGVAGLAIKFTNPDLDLKNKVSVLAAKSNLPIFEIPYSVTYVELMNKVNEYLSKEKANFELKKNLINYLIIPSSDNLSVKNELVKYSLTEWNNEETNFEELKIRVLITKDIDDSNKNNFNQLLEQHKRDLENPLQDYLFENNLDTYYIFLILNNDEDLEAWYKNFSDYSEKKLNISFHSSQLHSFLEVSKAFREAIYSLKLNRINGPNEVKYGDVRMYRKLENIDSDLLLDFFKPLKSIINDDVLIETLLVYFKCNESKKDTSEELFIHVNTLNYRLSKIEEITGLSLDNTNDKFKIYLTMIILLLKNLI